MLPSRPRHPEQGRDDLGRPPADRQREKIGAVVGALVAVAIGLYHNAHVNMWTGGHVLRPLGFVLVAVIGAVVGAVVAHWLARRPSPPTGG